MYSSKSNTQIGKQEEQAKNSTTKTALGVEAKLLYTGNYFNHRPVIADARNSVRSSLRRKKCPIPSAQVELFESPISEFTVLHLKKTDTSIENKYCVLPLKSQHTELPLDARPNESSTSETIVLRLNKTETCSENRFTQDTKQLPKTRQNFRASMSKSIVLQLNKTESSALNRELPSVYRQNNLDPCVTKSPKEQFGSSMGSSQNFQLFLQAILHFAKKAYPQVIQQLNRTDNQTITFTFTCDLKNGEVDSIINPQPSKQINTMKLQSNIVELAVLPKKLDIDFLNYNQTPSKNQIHIKLSLDNFLQNVLSLFPTTNDVFSSSAIRVPNLHFANWHFRNIAQGYLLRFVLSKINVITLNVMRNLYFIIITTKTANLFLEVNFTLKNDIFMLDDIITKPANDSCDGKTIRDDGSTCSFGTDSTFINDFGAFGLPIYKIGHEVFADSVSGDAISAFDSNSSMHTSHCTIVTGNRCAATSTTFSIQYSIFPKQTKDKSVGDETALFVQEKCKLKPNTKQYITVPTKNIQVSFLRMNYFNETIFERMSVVERYLQIVVCKCTSPEFCKVFFKCLGHTLGCTLISFFISQL